MKMMKSITLLLVVFDGSYQGILAKLYEKNVVSYRAIARNYSINETNFARIMMEKSIGIETKQNSVNELQFHITLFENNDAFSEGLNINFPVFLDKSTRKINFGKNVKYQFGKVGEDNFEKFEKYEIAFAQVESTVMNSNLEFQKGSSINISISFKNKKNIFFKVKIKEKINFKFQYIFYIGILSFLTLAQIMASIILCHRGINEKLKFIRKLPLIPCIQSWATDLTLILTTWQYFEVYSLIYKIQILMGVLGIPLLFHFFVNKNLFTGKQKYKKHVILGYIGIIVIFLNITVLIVFTKKVSYVCVMLMLGFILEGVVYNKRPRQLWFFWMYMVPKSLLMLYIYYWPYNLVLNPVDVKEMGIIILAGGSLFGALLLQKYWSPRFGFLTQMEKSRLKFKPKIIDLENIGESEIFKGLLDDFCAICWLGFKCEEDEEGSETFSGVLKAGEKLLETGCGHVFHESCLKAWVRRTPKCPTCRGKIVMEL